MTTTPAGQPTPDEALTAYEVALAALVVAAVAETGAVYDRLVPGLVEELPPRVRRLLGVTLAKSWAAYVVRSRSLAAVTAYAFTGRVPVPFPDPDLPRLIAAAETFLDRAESMSVGDGHADTRRAYDGPDLADDLARVGRQRTRESLDRIRADEALRAEQLMAAEVEAVARWEADLEARAEAEDRRERVEAARADLRAEREAQRAEREATREAEMEDARQRRREAEERAQARREARAERRRAQRARAENIARSESTAAAAEELPRALGDDPRFVGWVRKVNEGACERCRGWWMSGGDPRGASPVRPWSVPMKRHHGCTCTQRPVTREEADARGITTEPEPRLRNKPTARAAAGPDDAA